MYWNKIFFILVTYTHVVFFCKQGTLGAKQERKTPHTQTVKLLCQPLKAAVILNTYKMQPLIARRCVIRCVNVYANSLCTLKK